MLAGVVVNPTCGMSGERSRNAPPTMAPTGVLEPLESSSLPPSPPPPPPPPPLELRGDVEEEGGIEEEEGTEEEEGIEDAPALGGADPEDIPLLEETDVSVDETVLSLCDGLSWEGVLERETTGGVVGVASGSLPAAFADVGLNPLFYTQSVRHTEDPPAKCAYGIIQIRPMRDCGSGRNVEGVSGRDDEPLNRDEPVS